MNQYHLQLQRDLYLFLLGTTDQLQDIDTVLSNALQLIVKLTGAHLGYIELRNQQGNIWWSKQHFDKTNTVTIPPNISNSIISEAIRSGHTLLTSSAFLDPRFSEKNRTQNERIEKVLCSPFEFEGIAGVIYLQGKDNDSFASEQCIMETNLFSKHITPLLRQLHLKVESSKISCDLREKYNLSNIIGESQILIARLKEAMAIAELDITVLLTGETGTGKGAFARAIHENSQRRYKPFIHLNCANIPEHLAESELFGAVRGAHSGAYTNIKGKMAAAEGGTIFLDEIGVLPITIQTKLLQFLEDGFYYPLGSTIPHYSDIRIISATNIDFKNSIDSGTFKADLYYRLCVFPIELPPLRKRKEDIPDIVLYFINKHCNNYKMSVLDIEPNVLISLQEHDWPGNIREIENKVQQGILKARIEQSSQLLLHHLLPEQQETLFVTDTITYKEGKEYWERNFLNLHLCKNSWNISETAKSLDLSRSHLNNLIKMHQLERSNHRN